MVAGTRPEVVKLAPVLDAVRRHPALQARFCATGQQPQLLDQALEDLGIEPDLRLGTRTTGADHATFLADALVELGERLDERRPAVVVVQGDTTSTLVGALAAAVRQVPVAHVEAGLRSPDRSLPFPEDLHRRVVSQLAQCHFAPTVIAAANLRAEQVPTGDIHLVGNTGIDSFLAALQQHPGPLRQESIADAVATGRRIVLATAHRRESWGAPMGRIGASIDRLAVLHPDVTFVVVRHPNGALERANDGLAGRPNLLWADPLPYGSLCHLLQRSSVVLTDSGGLVEEATCLGRPVVVLRSETERPEALDAGVAHLAGTDVEEIVAATTAALAAPPPAPSPAFGDGRAAGRVAAGIAHLLGLGPRAIDLEPTAVRGAAGEEPSA